MSLGGGTNSVVETGMMAVGGNSVVENAAGMDVGVAEAVAGEFPAEETTGAHANKARVQKRTGRRSLLIST